MSATQHRRTPTAARLVLVAALGGLAMTPTARASTPTIEVATWWAGAQSSAAAVPGPDVPAGGLYVASDPGGPAAVSALRLRFARSSPHAKLELKVHAEHVADAMTLELLPTSTAWKAGDLQPWSTRPGWDQQLPPIKGIRYGGGFSFDLGGVLAGEVRSLLLLPTRAYSVQPGFAPDAPAQTFAITFDKPDRSSLVLATGASAEPVAQAIPRSAPQRPGPALLYAPAPVAPQLTNAPGSAWHASPLLVSGAAAYERGEYLYQGFLYDDHGAAGVVDANDPLTQNFLFASKAGTLTYPTDRAFVNNAADLLEFRVTTLPGATAFRVTFTSLVNPSKTAFTLALGTSATEHAWPAMAGVSSPAKLFLTVHGNRASLVDAASGRALVGTTVRVDAARHQYDVRVPHSAWNPGTSTQRMALGTGLWDLDGGHYLVPGASSTATAPGGVSPSQAALFDTAFRFHETMPDWTHMGLAYSLADGAVLVQADEKCFWRDCQQAAALQKGDISAFNADIDFGRLARRVTDERAVPRYGYIDRIHPSQFSWGQGIDPASACGRFPVKCHGMFLGNLQPYQVYVPHQAAPRNGWALTVMLHASGANHNERMGSRMERQLASRAGGSIVMTALARDPDGDYTDATEAEVFETWADVARHYPLDLTRTALVGYSMGGGGTYKMVQRWPDLFAAGFGGAAVPFDDGWQGQWFAGMRNVPMLTWIGTEDEGSGMNVQVAEIRYMEQYGYRMQVRQFPTSDHLTIATNDEYGEGVTWLGNRRVVVNPARISFVVDTRNNFSGTTMVANHAYWISGLTLRTKPAGAIEATSSGLGLADPAVVGRSTTPGVLMGGQHGPMPYVDSKQDWTLPRAAVANHLDLQVRNLSSVVVDLARAHLTCAATVTVHNDGPVLVSFPLCGKAFQFTAGTATLRL